jgi:uncharacterized protein YhbP (UPF0306 family)
MKSIEVLVQEVLAKGHLMSLATIDDGGPWVSDVIYVHREPLEIFWMSDSNTRHSQAIHKDTRVAATITIGDGKGGTNIGLQISGTAEKVEGDILEVAAKHRAKRGKPAPQKEGEVLEGSESWYRLKPTKIELIYEPHFGFEKKKIL